MRISETLKFTDDNINDLECLLKNKGEIFIEGGKYTYQTDTGVIPDLDIARLIKSGIIKIKENSKISVLIVVYKLVVENFDIRHLYENGGVDHLTSNDLALAKMILGSDIKEHVELPYIRIGLANGFL